MLEDIVVLRAYFSKLGLEPEVADLYLALHTYGPQTISELSRRAAVERTRIYRLIDILAASNLIEVETHYKRRVLKAAPVGNLQILLSEKEEELLTLQAELSVVQQAVTHRQSVTHATQVQFYRGIEGIKQMLWNEIRSTTGNLAIFHENMQSKTNAAFFDRWVREFNQRGISCRGLIGDDFIASQKQWYKRRDSERIANWEARYVAKSQFKITHSIVIYNDVVAYYSWRSGLFGIEIHNQEIADAQRAFFEMLWQQSAPIPKSISQQLGTS